MKVLTFGASSSSKSINQQLALYAAQTLAAKSEQQVEIDLLDINDYEMPLYSQDREEELGQPEQAKAFLARITEADAIIISFAEHNGSYTAAYKNLYDWASRIDMKVYQNKPMVVLAASPGPSGAKNILSVAISSMPHFGGDVKSSLSVPSFYDNFDLNDQVITNKGIANEIKEAVQSLL